MTLCDREQDLLSRVKSLMDSWLSAVVTVRQRKLEKDMWYLMYQQDAD